MPQSSGQSPADSTHTGLLFTLTIIAALGGLLFGYDTAVISGATDSIKSNFVALARAFSGADLLSDTAITTLPRPLYGGRVTRTPAGSKK